MVPVKKSPVAFANLFLTHLFPYRTPEFHHEIFQLIFNENRIAIAAPRSFAKSTIASLVYPLWLALFSEKKEDILIVSSTYSLAEEWIRKIKFELEVNEKLRALVGPQESDKWAADHIILSNGNQIRAKGKNYQIRGFRPTRVIVDDIEDDDEVRSEEQRNKLKDWFWKALVNTLERDSQLIVIGTLLHPQSLLSNLLENNQWVSRIFKAVTNERSLWEEKWPYEDLLKRKEEIGSLAFEAEYQNNPQAALAGIWKPEYFQWFEDRELRDLFIITTIDPAISKRETADYSAINTLGVVTSGEHRGRIYNLDARRGRWSMREISEELFKINNVYSPQVIWIEEVGFQQALREVLDKEMIDRGITLPIRRIQLGRGWTKKARDKTTRAVSIVYLAEQGKVFLRKQQQTLYDELIMFPYADHDDLHDAFVYGLMVVKEMEQIGAIVGSNSSTGSVIRRGAEVIPSFEIIDGTMPGEPWVFEKERKREWKYY